MHVRRFKSCVMHALVLFGAGLSCAAAAFGEPAPLRLTNTAYNDYYPAWDPAGETIVFSRQNYSTGTKLYLNNIYQVKGDNSSPEALVATGYPFSEGGGLGTGYQISWIGTTNRFLLAELVFFHEYLSFNMAKAPYARTISDGSDVAGAFSRALLIDGGGGGLMSRVSRDGSKVLIRYSGSGGSGETLIMTGPVSSVTSQAIRWGAGAWKNAAGVVTHITEAVPSDKQLFLSGAAFVPDGSKFVIARHVSQANLKHDLWLFNTDGSGTPLNLTNVGTSGRDFRFPDISAEGQKIICSCSDSSSANTTWDLCTLNLDGSGLDNLTNSDSFNEYYPTWSPTADRVAFMGSWKAGYVPAGESAVWKIYVASLVGEEFKFYLALLQRLLAKLKNPKMTGDAAQDRIKLVKLTQQTSQIKAVLGVMDGLVNSAGGQIRLADSAVNIQAAMSALRRFIAKALKVKNVKFPANKKKALNETRRLLDMVL